jgi:predicted membrane-bound mannosyltransferase
VDKRWRGFAVGLVLVAATGLLPGLVRAYDQKQIHWKTLIPGYQTIDLNFINYDNDNRYYVYVYAHTRREALKLVDEINRIAQRTHQGGATGITIVSPDYWPLPWYLRDYSRVGYYGHVTTSNEPIIISSQNQAGEVQATYGDRYQQVQSGFNTAGSFPLRPGVDLLLFTRRELVR